MALLLLAGCGGGGDVKGECVFGTSGCSYGVGSTSTSGSGSSSAFTQSGTGESVSVIPSNVNVLRIQAQFAGNSSDSVAQVAGQLLVNEIIGTSRSPPSFDGTYVVTPGAQLQASSHPILIHAEALMRVSAYFGGGHHADGDKGAKAPERR